jgi:hypothetical protein
MGKEPKKSRNELAEVARSGVELIPPALAPTFSTNKT